jgi:hypothetical protein
MEKHSGNQERNGSSECENAEVGDRNDPTGSEVGTQDDECSDSDLHPTWHGYVEDDAVVLNEWRTVCAADKHAAREQIERDVISRSMEAGVAPDFTIHVIIKHMEYGEEQTSE